MKETEEKHFKRFLTKDKAEIHALREANRRFTGLIIKQKTLCFYFPMFLGRMLTMQEAAGVETITNYNAMVRLMNMSLRLFLTLNKCFSC